MKVVILAGGKGTRISEETKVKPKPLIEIGDFPIIWHIMNRYSLYGFNEFIVCCGYRGHMIKDYFINYHANNNHLEINLEDGKFHVINNRSVDWKVTLVDTGFETLTSGRLLKVKDYLDGEKFMLTYGDGVGNIDIQELLQFHNKQDKIVTISTTQPDGRFGTIKINHETNEVNSFEEKRRTDQSWINIGFMVMEPEVFDYLGAGDTMLEDMPFEKLAQDGKMAAYRHNGFWSPMDNIRDKEYLNNLWDEGAGLW